MSKQGTRVLWIDHITREQTQGGVNRYLNKMLAAFQEFYQDAFAACTYSSGAPPGLKRLPLPNLRVPGMYRFRFNRALELIDQRLLERAVSRLKPELIFSPYYGPIVRRVPQVFVVYDLIVELFASVSVDDRFRSQVLAQRQRCYEAAAALFCISEHTRHDLLRLYPSIDPANVFVTHLGVEDFFLKSSPDEQPPHLSESANRPYFLYVGRRGGYKNFTRLLDAFGAGRFGADFDLRVVGPTAAERNWSDEERELISKYALSDSITLELGVTEERLRKLYRGAVAFVFPSEYEGFGLPVLEAMACGTIVVASNASSVPEVGGEVPLYFDPSSEESLSSALRRAATFSEPQRREKCEAGVARAQTFSWKKCEQRTISLVEEVLARGDC